MTENLMPGSGNSQPRSDGYGKVTGSERYAADQYPEGYIMGGVVRSPHPHARILSIDMSGALTCPGVIAVLTSRDIRGTNRVGLPEMDQPVLADEKVRFIGDPVALILAEDTGSLSAACAAVRVEYEVLDPVFDPEIALEAGAPLIHEGHEGGNLLFSAEIVRGTGAQAFSDCAAIAEGEFILPRQEHAYLETEVGVARITDDGVLEMVVSTQSPFRDAREIAEALGIPADHVRVTAPYLGGAFGGKDGITVQGLLGLGALHAHGRWVKIWTGREESFVTSTKRHPARITIRLGCLADGTLHALACSLLYDTGAYAGLGGPILIYGMGHACGVYRIPHCQINGRNVYTNNPVSGAFRGFGIPQVLTGLEQLIDILAAKIGMDPLEFRLKNAVSPGDENGLGVIMGPSTGIIPCLEELRAHPLWTGRKTWIEDSPTCRRRGVGIAAALIGIGYGPVIPDVASAKIELLPDGRFRIYAGVADMGQGNNPTNIQIAASLLNQDPHLIEQIQPDTFRCLPSSSSSASRTTYTYGKALISAIHILKTRICETARNERPGWNMEEIRFEPGRIVHIPDGEEIALSRLSSQMGESDRIATATWTAPVNTQSFDLPPLVKMAGFPHLVYSFTAHLARVEVDELTGRVTVDSYLACTDAGRILNQQVYEQQVQGAVVQGIGYALFEDFQVQEGRVVTRNLATYILPTARDVPDITIIPVEIDGSDGPFGLKGVGEIGIAAVVPGIANALADALGTRIFQSPYTPERVLHALREES